MADALCGPSNALQTFQKQTSVDRTLQQDRLAARQAQAESFRSLPGPNVGIIDAEFEAFQAGHPLETVYLDPQLSSYHDPVTSFQSNSQQHPNPPSNWASDFQNLNLGGPQSSPIPQSQFHHHAPLQRSKPSGWQEDFLRHQNHTSAYPLQQQQGPAVNRAYGYVGGIIPQQDTMLSPIAQQKQPERQVDDIYDEAAFERAFENARSETHLQQTDTQLDQDLYRTEEAGRKLNSTEDDTWRDHHRIGSDRILEEAEENKDKSNDETDADELARTAGLLLENVKDDQSRKFQESSFLALMRQLRDKEIRVEGDKLVDGGVYLYLKDDVLNRNMLKKVNRYLRKKYGKVIIDSSTQSSAKKVAKVRVRGQEVQSVPGKQPRLILYYTISHGGEFPQEEQFDGVWRAIKDQVRFLEHQKRLAEESER